MKTNFFLPTNARQVIPGSENIPYKAANVQGATTTFLWMKDSILFPNNPNEAVKLLAYYSYSGSGVTNFDYIVTVGSIPPFTARLPTVDGSYSLKKGKRYIFYVKPRDRMVLLLEAPSTTERT